MEIVAKALDAVDAPHGAVDRPLPGITLHQTGQIHDTLVHRDLDRGIAILPLGRQLRADVLVNLGVALLVRHGATLHPWPPLVLIGTAERNCAAPF